MWGRDAQTEGEAEVGRSPSPCWASPPGVGRGSFQRLLNDPRPAPPRPQPDPRAPRASTGPTVGGSGPPAGVSRSPF